MSDFKTIDISQQEPRGNECWITIDNQHVSLRWDRPLPETGKPTRVERIAAAALVGIARELAGKAADDLTRATAAMERKTRK